MRVLVLFVLAFTGCTFGIAPVSFDDATATDGGALDLAPARDLAPPLDLAPLADLTPIPTFAGKVQPDISAMGCDSAACHGSVNPVAPKPVLLASPSSLSQVMFNYTNAVPFGTSGTLLSRPLATSGGTHPKFFTTVADARYQAWALWVRGGEPLQ